MPVVYKYSRRPYHGRISAIRKAPDPFNAIADQLTPKLRDALTRELQGALTPGQMDELVRAIRSSDISAIRTLLPTYKPSDPGPWEDVANSYTDTMSDVLQRTGNKALLAYGIRASFTLDNPYTDKWLRERTGMLISDIADDARNNIIEMVRSGWADGIPPRELAQLIKPHLGLNEQQAGAVQRRYESTAQALEDGGMPAARAASVAATRVEPYADDLLSQRATNIARTETIAASTAGAHDAWSDAKDKGYLPEKTQREWVASPEGKGACPYCVELDGQRVDFDDDFETSLPGLDGSINRPPAHTSCRCTVRIVIPGLSDSQSLDDIREENEQFENNRRA